jgi:hypothetical protein
VVGLVNFDILCYMFISAVFFIYDVVRVFGILLVKLKRAAEGIKHTVGPEDNDSAFVCLPAVEYLCED